MIYRFPSVLIALTAVALLGSAARAADAPKELRTDKGKPVVLGNFLNVPSDCTANPGPNPLPVLREKPSHGFVRMQVVVADVPAAGSCQARKMPAIALFYAPNADFVGVDSVQVEFETGDTKTPTLSFRITVQAPEAK